jgi:hypothetical protein
VIAIERRGAAPNGGLMKSTGARRARLWARLQAAGRLLSTASEGFENSVRTQLVCPIRDREPSDQWPCLATQARRTGATNAESHEKIRLSRAGAGGEAANLDAGREQIGRWRACRGMRTPAPVMHSMIPGPRVMFAFIQGALRHASRPPVVMHCVAMSKLHEWLAK